MAFDAVSFAQMIRDEVAKVPQVKLGTTQSFIPCPFHSERTPSGRLRHDPDKAGIGSFKCYGCGQKATWNEVAAKLGLQQFGKDKAETATVPFTNFIAHEDRLFGSEKKDKTEVRRGMQPERFSLLSPNSEYAGLSGEWRGYSLEFLDSIGAKLLFDPMREKYYILLIVYVRNEEVGYIQAELEKPKDKKYPSYWNKKGTWSLTHGLFPYDAAIKLMKASDLTTLVLVEGPRDALRLVRSGIPACSILGTHSWSAQKRRLLEFAGVTRLVTMFDGDEAGLKAHLLVKEDCKDVFDYKAVKLWKYPVPDDHPEDKLDPGNCPESMLTQLKKQLI